MKGQKLSSMEGQMCPWNTIAMWNLNKIGTPGVSSRSQLMACIDQKMALPQLAAGIEEVAHSSSFINKLIPAGSKAKLVKVDGVVEWRQEREDEEREENGTMTR